MSKKKIFIIIALVILGIIAVAGTTYAIYTWAMSEEMSGTSQCFNIKYYKGQNIGGTNGTRTITPSNDYTGGLVATVTVGTDSSCGITTGVGTLYLTTDETTSEILLTSGALKYQIIEGTSTLGTAGTISSTGKVAVGENISITSSLKQISLIVWLDGSAINEENVEEILSSSYSGSISMSVESGDA